MSSQGKTEADDAEVTGVRVHYDTPPPVFEYLLDRNMNYSSGVYPRGDETLDDAQVAKMEGIARVLRLEDGHRILDMGCGWSGPALYWAEQYGCRVTGVTLSPVQRDYALKWAERRGVSDRLMIDLRDVMDLPYPKESFDRITFLESIIHMPEKDLLFARGYELLKPGGMIFVQESHYDRASMRSRYLADRGFDEVNRAFGFTAHLVSCGEMLIHLEEARLIPEYVENISGHYQRTLSQWLDRLDVHGEIMRQISEPAWRMLRRYLMIALATYNAGGTVCYQIAASKPRG